MIICRVRTTLWKTSNLNKSCFVWYIIILIFNIWYLISNEMNHVVTNWWFFMLFILLFSILILLFSQEYFSFSSQFLCLVFTLNVSVLFWVSYYLSRLYIIVQFLFLFFSNYHKLHVSDWSKTSWAINRFLYRAQHGI